MTASAAQSLRTAVCSGKGPASVGLRQVRVQGYEVFDKSAPLTYYRQSMSMNPPKAESPAFSLLKPIKVLALLSLLAAAAATFVIVQDIRLYAKTPVEPAGDSERILVIAPGESFQSVSQKLFTLGLIRSPLRFKLYARFSGHHRAVKAGEYSFYSANSPREILDRLVEGKVKLYRITVPEGFAVRQIADLVTGAGFSDRDAFIKSATDPEVSKALGIQEASLEGYLFPDTYHFPRGSSVNDILAAMVNRFQAIMTEARRARAEAIGLTVHQVVTLASIIEKETGEPSERPLISSVFHNRLKKRMRLETDPTVIYGIQNFDGNLTRKHLRTPTPYNTYLIRGLPPGPIASPGEAAIDAALYPAETNYLFFVSRKDRTHQFSETLREHQRAVRKYQLGGRKRKK